MRLMFGPRITTVFASRWKALWWAGGIMLTAYCTIPSADEPTSAADQAAAAQAAKQIDNLNSNLASLNEQSTPD